MKTPQRMAEVFGMLLVVFFFFCGLARMVFAASEGEMEANL